MSMQDWMRIGRVAGLVGGACTHEAGTTSITASSSASGDGSTSTTGTTGGDASDVGSATLDSSGDDEGTKLDVDVPPPGGTIPSTCEEAEAFASTMGCRFYTLDLDQLDEYESGDVSPYTVVVSNVQSAAVAEVVLEQRIAGVWTPVAGPVTLEPGELEAFERPDFHQEGTGIAIGGAARLTSDVPIAAYQFNPLVPQPDGASADATVLLPTGSLESLYHVVGMSPGGIFDEPAGGHQAYVTIVATVDATEVEVTTSIPTTPGGTVGPAEPGVPLVVALDEGDVLELASDVDTDAFTGTVVRTDPEHPVAVFSGCECCLVAGNGCDHLEVQMTGLELWGREFVAARVPKRSTDSSVWQLYASEDDTEITFTAADTVSGVPDGPVTLDRGEVLELEVNGEDVDPGHFHVDASAPIAVLNYMTSFDDGVGDPSMVQLAAVEQFLQRYVFILPPDWPMNMIVITKPKSVSAYLDDVLVDESLFVPVGAAYEVATFEISSGVHELAGSGPLAATLTAWREAESYVYLAGAGTQIINPDPEG